MIIIPFCAEQENNAPNTNTSSMQQAPICTTKGMIGTRRRRGQEHPHLSTVAASNNVLQEEKPQSVNHSIIGKRCIAKRSVFFVIGLVGIVACFLVVCPSTIQVVAMAREMATANPAINNTFCFVHVGKAAGSTLSCALGYNYAPKCEEFRKLRSTVSNGLMTHSNNQQLVRHHGGHLHMWTRKCQPEDALFLVTLRNPVERLISWYQFEHLRNEEMRQYIHDNPTGPGVLKGGACAYRLYRWQGEGCFDTFNEFAENCTRQSETWSRKAIQQANLTTVKSLLGKSSCQQLAWMTARGVADCAFHNGYNYAYYAEIIDELRRQRHPQTSKLFAIRAEFMADDWDQLERWFGGDSQVGRILFNTTLNASGRGNHRRMSELGYANLCRALCPEIQVYKRLLKEAENLSAAQVQQSILQVKRLCPLETEAVRDCD